MHNSSKSLSLSKMERSMVSFSLTFLSCLATHGFCSSVSLTSIVRPRTNLHLHARANGPIFLPDSNLISFSEIVNLEFYFGKVFWKNSREPKREVGQLLLNLTFYLHSRSSHLSQLASSSNGSWGKLFKKEKSIFHGIIANILRLANAYTYTQAGK